MGPAGGPAVDEREASELADYPAVIEKIRVAAAGSNRAHDLLRTLCVDIGPRLTGSEGLDRALAWARDTMIASGHENVAIEPVTVPGWVRGAESATMGPKKDPLQVLGLGGSVPTAKRGTTGEVVAVRSWEELEAKAGEVKGKIVFFDVRLQLDPKTGFPNYGPLVAFRRAGPSRAAKLGAKATLIRSLTTDPDSPPHTGAVDYAADAPKIPAAALSWRSADALADALAKKKTKVTLSLQSRDLGPVSSGNVIGELRGRERPEEIVVVGGHIDSWDVGQGAHDNGTGVVIAMAALDLLRELDLRPRRTLRVVLWTEEERNEGGAAAYAEQHAAETHVAAFESDSGGAPVAMISMQTRDMKMGPPGTIDPPPGFSRVEAVVDLLRPQGVRAALPFFAGTDLKPLVAQGITGFGIFHDATHYFDVHHSEADVFERVDAASLQQSVSVTAALAYIVADLPDPI